MKKLICLLFVLVLAGCVQAEPVTGPRLPGSRGVSAGVTPLPPAYYASWAYGTVAPPTRLPGDPLGAGKQAYGINATQYLASVDGVTGGAWDTAPTGCTTDWCTTSNIDWSGYDAIITAQAAHDVVLSDGTTRTSPVIVNVPPMYIDAEADSSCGTAGDPCTRVFAPSWLSSSCVRTFQNTVGSYLSGGVRIYSNWYYNGFAYDTPICVNRLKQFISEAAARWGEDDRVVALRLNVGFAGEGQPNKKSRYDVGTEAQLIASHEANMLSCATYTAFVKDLSEYAYTEWQETYHKPLFVMLGPAPCASSGLDGGHKYRQALETDATYGGWSLPETYKDIGYSLNANPADRADMDSRPGNSYQAYYWYRFGDFARAKGVGLIYESAYNPTDATVSADPWAYQVWAWYAQAGVGADGALNNRYWLPYASGVLWEVNDWWLGNNPNRAWLVFRDAEWLTYNWTSINGVSGMRAPWGNWLSLPAYADYGQACNSTLRSQVASQKSAIGGAMTIYHEPCEATLPTPAVTPRPTVTPGDTTDEYNRVSNRQALTLAAGDEMDLVLSSGSVHYGYTESVTVTLGYLDTGTDDISVVLPTTSGPITHTITKTNSKRWVRTTYAQANVVIANNLTGTDNAAFVIVANDATATEYLHELYIDFARTLAGPTPTPLPTATPTATPTFTPTPPPTPTVTPTPSYPAGVRFNEVSPTDLYDWNLSGDVNAADRWFELVNWSATAVDLAGYRVSNGSASHTFSGAVMLAAYSRRVFLAEDTVLLPDTGTLRLYNVSNTEIASASWIAEGLPGECYAALPDASVTWDWTVCTPGTANEE